MIKSSYVQSPELTALLEKAARHVMTPEEIRAQRRSFVVAEAGFGSDADEAAYRAAYDAGDKTEIERLDFESGLRMTMAREYMDGQA